MVWRNTRDGSRRRRRARLASALALLAVTSAGTAVAHGEGSQPDGNRQASVGAAIATPLLAGAPAAAQADDELRVEQHVLYSVDPKASVVHARHTITLTNESPDTYYTYSYLDRFAVPVVSGSVGLSASRDGTPLPVALESLDNPWIAAAVVDLNPNLFYRDTQTITLTYDMPSVPPRSDGATRVNDAFAAFPVFGDGDPGLLSIEVRVPKRFETEVVGDIMDETEEGDFLVLRAAGIEDPWLWFAAITARDDERLLAEDIDVGGEEDVVVRAWPDDQQWLDFVTEQVTDGVPLLAEMIGLDWPADSTIDVVESVAPYVYGYAGWYVPLESLIEVGDALDQHVVLHELAHLWFNRDLFTVRWINEAFADVFAAAAAAEMGDEPPRPEAVDLGSPGAVRLNEWSDPRHYDTVSFEQEHFGYNASWSIIQEIADEIGLEKLAEVVQEADARRIAYRGDAEVLELVRAFGWRELLDLLVDVGGSERALPLFAAHVVAEGDDWDLSEREKSRGKYDELVARGGGWTTPAAVRRAMADWRFSAAEGLMEDTHAVLDVRDQIYEVLDGLPVEGDLHLEEAFESADDNLDELRGEAEDALEAATALRAARTERDRSVGPLGAIGLALSPADDQLDRATSALVAGDYERSLAASQQVEDTMDAAVQAGVARIAAVLMLALAVVLLVRVRRATMA